MRTTVDIPDDLHRIARQLAADEGLSMSEVISRLLRNGLGARSELAFTTDPDTGLPVVEIGRTITSEDVAELVEDA